MSKDRVIDSLGRIDDDMIQGVEALRQKKKRPAWTRWGAMVACLCLIVASTFVIPRITDPSPSGVPIPNPDGTIQRGDEPDVYPDHPILRPGDEGYVSPGTEPAESPNDTMEPSDGPSSLMVNGVSYLISSHLAVSDELPDGFVYAGEASVAGFERCPYYTNPDMPEWVYVYHEVSTDGTVDASGTLNRTEPHGAYVRYVDVRLRGKELVCYNGEYYISMWSAQDYGSSPDVSREYYDNMKSTYGIRIEGDAPDGFVSVGIAEYSGNDTIPRGMLVSNEGAYEVYADPSNLDVVLVATKWHTAPVGENGETDHSGFNVYIRYDCPWA